MKKKRNMSKQIDDVLKAPLLTIITIITVVISLLNQASNLLDLAPFASDIVLSIWFFYLSVYSSQSALNNIKESHTIIFADIYSLKRSTKRKIILRLLMKSKLIWIAAIMFYFFVYNINYPIYHLFSKQYLWELNYQVKEDYICETKPCAVLYDRKKRPITKECYQLTRSDFIKEKSSEWWIYCPVYYSLKCKGRILPETTKAIDKKHCKKQKRSDK